MLVERGEVARISAVALLLRKAFASPSDDPEVDGELADRLEQITLGMPAITEIDVLRREAAGGLMLPAPLRTELRRLLFGGSTTSRLSLPDDSDLTVQRDAAAAGLARWRSAINSGRIPFGSRDAAEIVARAYDRLWSWTQERL